MLKYFLLIVFFIVNFAQADEADLQLRLVETRIMFEDSREQEALELFEQLHSKYPDNAGLLAARSSFEYQINRFKKAYDYINKALEIDPDNQDLQQLYREIIKNHQSFFFAEYIFETRTGSIDQDLSLLQFEQQIKPFKNWGIKLQASDFSAANLQRLNGVQSQTSVFQPQAELYLKKHYDNGDYTKGDIYIARDVVGLGTEYAFWYIKGFNSIILEYKKPNRDFIEGIADRGSRNKIGLKNSYRFSSRLASEAEIAYHQYNLSTEDNLADSLSFDASVFYNLRPHNNIVELFGDHANLIIGYNLDAEYKNSVEERIGDNGNLFAPLPLTTREVHSVSLIASKYLLPKLYGRGSVGYAKDRFG